MCAGGPFVRRSRTIFAILVEGFLGTILLNYFEFGPVVQKMLFKNISYLELWRHFCLAEQNHLCNFGRSHHEQQFCEIILNLYQWFRRCLYSRCLEALLFCGVEPFVQFW